MPNERRTRGGGPLPLEVRRILWQRLWDRLLALPCGASDNSSAPHVAGEEVRISAPLTGGEGR